MPQSQSELTPRQIVSELDRDIVGQADAKRAVAIALRNRWRRRQLPDELRAQVTPKNIMLIGPTGVGKTEIARRLAMLVGAPFVKTEATKYTEVGYYGRDVESLIRDLVEAAILLVRTAERETVEEQAKQRVEQRLLDMLLPSPPPQPTNWSDGETNQSDEAAERRQRSREKMKNRLLAGELEDREVEITIPGRNVAPVSILGAANMEQMEMDLQNMFEKIMPKQTQSRRMSVREARPILLQQEIDALIDPEKMNQAAVRLTEETGIVFIDELDKIASDEGSVRGPDVSRQGVQRDLLPIVEGTTVNTKYGPVKTDHVLFVAAGAFHRSKPSDLMPELQGRFPIRVEMHDLTRDDFARILREPRHRSSASTKPCSAPRECNSNSPATPSRPWLIWRLQSTGRPRTSAHAACIRSSNAFSKTSALMPRIDRTRRLSSMKNLSGSDSRRFPRMKI